MKQHEIDGTVVEWCLDKSAASSNQEAGNRLNINERRLRFRKRSAV